MEYKLNDLKDMPAEIWPGDKIFYKVWGIEAGPEPCSENVAAKLAESRSTYIKRCFLINEEEYGTADHKA